MTQTDTGAVGFDDTIPRRAWLALFVSTLVTFFVVIDVSAVNVAFPSIREDFEVSAAELRLGVEVHRREKFPGLHCDS